MSARNPIVRTANSLSLAAWFGGSLMGLVGVPRAVARASDGDQVRAEGDAWSAWQPVQTAAIVTQLVSGAALTVVNARRVVGQRGVARTTVVRSLLTGAAVGATALAARTGKQLEQSVGDDGADERDESLARRVRALQAAVPLLTGAMIAMDALMGEQQRPSQVLRGTAQRLLPGAIADRLGP